jgi:hypothetical protein
MELNKTAANRLAREMAKLVSDRRLFRAERMDKLRAMGGRAVAEMGGSIAPGDVKGAEVDILRVLHSDDRATPEQYAAQVQRAMRSMRDQDNHGAKDFLTPIWNKKHNKNLPHLFSIQAARQSMQRDGTLKYTWTRGSGLADVKSTGHWGSDAAKPVDPDEMVTLIHGGGQRAVNDFLAGKWHGYKLEDRGRGLQVHPVLDKHLPIDENIGARARYYAQHGSIRHLDQPVVLTARVPARYLDRAVNGYEAGLRSEAVQHLQDVKVERFNPGRSWAASGVDSGRDYSRMPAKQREFYEGIDRFAGHWA